MVELDHKIVAVQDLEHQEDTSVHEEQQQVPLLQGASVKIVPGDRRTDYQQEKAIIVYKQKQQSPEKKQVKQH